MAQVGREAYFGQSVLFQLLLVVFTPGVRSDF